MPIICVGRMYFVFAPVLYGVWSTLLLLQLLSQAYSLLSSTNTITTLSISKVVLIISYE